MKLIDKYIGLSRQGEAVWISEVREAFASEPGTKALKLRLCCLDGGEREYLCPVPAWETQEQRSFILEYLKAGVFNVLSCYSGRSLHICLNMGDRELRELTEDCLASFRKEPGLKKVLNIAGRLCRSLGLPDFEMGLESLEGQGPTPGAKAQAEESLGTKLRRAVEDCSRGAFCGIDVGGTDIKLALALDGKLLAVKEYDWNPGSSPVAEGLIRPILLLAGLMQARLAAEALPEDSRERRLMERALEKNASHEQMEKAIKACSGNEPPRFSGIGLSFPDVVIHNRILGGETPKTKGMRENPELDYETEFSKLSCLGGELEKLCLSGGRVEIVNDGPMAAFSAAAELAWGGEDVRKGIVAHSLGTDLGSGWIKGSGEIPDIPLELYDLLVDLGSEKWRAYPAEDLRSVKNENSGLPGLRRYLGQAAAYRMAWQLEPELLKGFTEEKNGLLEICVSPRDLRKPCLEHLMQAAAEGDGAAREIFRRVGRNLAQMTREMEHLLDTGAGSRYLFGRFVKESACFRLIREGFKELLPDMELRAADDSLALTPLMAQLAEREDVTVAQFAQAVSAIYFSAFDRG